MLVPQARQVGMPVHILPSELLRQRGSGEIGVGQRTDDVIEGGRVGIWVVLGPRAARQEGGEEERDGAEEGRHGFIFSRV